MSVINWPVFDASEMKTLLVDLEPKAVPDPDHTCFELWREIDTY